MTWWECLLIIAGISFDVFAVMEIQGAMLAEVKMKSLAVACVLVTLLQLIFFYGGYMACYYVELQEIIKNGQYVGYVIACIVFGLLGLRLLVKAVKREFVHERRGELNARTYIKVIAVTTLYTLAAGCVCGLLSASWLAMLILLLVCSVLTVMGGLFFGYHYGFEAKTGFYIVGTVLLWVAAAEILIRGVLV